MASWSTWGGTYTYSPTRIVYPSTQEELVEAIKSATNEGKRVKVAGTGHSFTDIAGTDGVCIKLDQYSDLIEVDRSRSTVTVQAGITISALGRLLAEHGLALPSLGDIGYQTISGAVSTGTHGTGVRFGGIASQIRALDLVTADGSVVHCDDQNPDLLNAARVGLGALGAISTVTLDCVPYFNLHSVERPASMSESLERLDEWVDGNDHFELYWFPHTDKVMTLTHNRTDEPLRPKSPTRRYVEDVLMENHLFGLLCRIGATRPSWIPAIARTTAKALSKSVTIDRSDLVFTNPRRVRFVEMEYAIPRENGPEALIRVKRMIEQENLLVSFPIEFRFVGPEEIMLSTSHARETAYIAVHMFRGTSFERYFRKVEEIMNDYGGRPHWGKMHYQTEATLVDRYPRWSEFRAVRDRLDPDRRFTNPYLERVLGS